MLLALIISVLLPVATPTVRAQEFDEPMWAIPAHGFQGFGLAGELYGALSDTNPKPDRVFYILELTGHTDPLWQGNLPGFGWHTPGPLTQNRLLWTHQRYKYGSINLYAREMALNSIAKFYHNEYRVLSDYDARGDAYAALSSEDDWLYSLPVYDSLFPAAFDSRTGEELWTFDGAPGAQPLHSPAIGTDDVVFSAALESVGASNREYFLFGIDGRAAGSQLWRHSLGQLPYGTALGYSLLVGGDGTLYVTLGEDLLALNPMDGAELWRASSPGRLYAMSADNILLAITYSGRYDPEFENRLVAFDAVGRSVLWSEAIDRGMSSGGDSSAHEFALSADNLVLVQSKTTKRLLGYRLHTGELAYEIAADRFHGLGATGRMIISRGDMLVALAGRAPLADAPWPTRLRDNRRTRRSTTRQPVLREPPRTIRAVVGQRFALSVVSDGAFPRAYQWLHEGQPLPGQTGSWIEFPDPTKAQSGSYEVQVSNEFGEAQSEPAQVTIRAFGTPTISANSRWVDDQIDALGYARVAISSSLPNGSIFYTLDGSTPDFRSPEYTTPFTLRTNTAVRAIAYGADFTPTDEEGPITMNIIPAFSVTTRAEGSGRVDVMPDLQKYAIGTEATFSATPTEDAWRFSHWAGDLTGTSPVKTVVIDQNLSVTGVFELIPWYLVVASTAGGGRVTGDASGRRYRAGTELTFEAVADEGWDFVRWQGSTNDLNPVLDVVVYTNLTYEAVFATEFGGVSVVGEGTASVAPVLERYEYGNTFTATGLAAEGYYFARWGGDVQGGVSPESFRIEKAGTRLSALFAELRPGEQALNVTLDGPGTVSVNPPRNYFTAGESAHLVAFPANGALFIEWQEDGSGSDEGLTLTMDSSKSVVAVFAAELEFETELCQWSPHGFVLAVRGVAGARCRIQHTSDFMAWEDLTELQLSGEPDFVLDTKAKHGTSRFYRASTVP